MIGPSRATPRRARRRAAGLLTVVLGLIACAPLTALVLSNARVEQASLPPDGFVDRIEGELAIIVTAEGAVLEWPSAGLAEGTVIQDGRLDAQATSELREGVRSLRRALSAGDDLEDLEL